MTISACYLEATSRTRTYVRIGMNLHVLTNGLGPAHNIDMSVDKAKSERCLTNAGGKEGRSFCHPVNGMAMTMST